MKPYSKAIFLLTIIATASLVTGCATTTHVASFPEAGLSGGVRHTVKPGETLWSISKTYNVEIDDLLTANSIRDASVVSSGRILIIPGSKKTDFVPQRTFAKDSFDWPVRGRVISAYGERIDGAKNKGIDIKAEYGERVRPSRSGRVVYCDSSMKGFGKTVILDHGDRYQTVYSYNSDISVKVGDPVTRNDVIAAAGRTGRARETSLHFEIRKDGKPQNPMYYLP